MPAHDLELETCLLQRLNQVRVSLGMEPVPDPAVRFADAVDSMGLVEFIALLADACGVTSDAIEETVQRHFTTVADLAQALVAAGISPFARQSPASSTSLCAERVPPLWLNAVATRLPATVEPATLLNARLQRPAGWLEQHAGLFQRYVWGELDPVAAAVQASAQALDMAGLRPGDIAALLLTSEAPPLAVGLAAALHSRLGLPPDAAALEIGGACNGFLSSVWTARRLAPEGLVLVVAVEAPSRWLSVEPGPAGEAAALFGDAATACVLSSQPTGQASIPLADVAIHCDGAAADLLEVQHQPGQSIALQMDGLTLAARAVRTMAQAVQDVASSRGVTLDRVAAIIAHAGNGRMPDMLARQLGVAPARIWSETGHTGNLGSASLPVAWKARGGVQGPAIWVAVGAGLVWGTALSGTELDGATGAT
jgi:3-oxoacyl-[acyl-carrier-protein] synthase-3